MRIVALHIVEIGDIKNFSELAGIAKLFKGRYRSMDSICRFANSGFIFPSKELAEQFLEKTKGWPTHE